MAYVSQTQDENAPTVLIVENNAMSIQRLTNIFKIKDFNIEICQDGDKAVDEYIRIDPELVLISLDIPSLDGHIAALEMREHGGDARIVFIAPKRLASLASDAAFSAGAVAWLQKPITSTMIDENWSTILGAIPDAPGLEDLDELYPIDRVKPEDDDGPMELPALPGMPLPGLPMPGLPLPNLASAEENAELEINLPTPGGITNDATNKKQRGKKKYLFVLLVLVGAGYYAYSNSLI